MIVFLRNNLFLFFLFIFLILLGQLNQIAAFIAGVVGLVYLLTKNSNLQIILFFFGSLVMSDSRYVQLDFFENLRIVSLLFLVFGVINKTTSKSLGPNFGFLFFPMLFLGLVSISNNPEPFGAFQKVSSYYLLFFSIPLVFAQHSIKFKNEILKGLIMLCAWIIIIGFVVFVFFQEITTLAGRFRGIMGNPNGLALFTILNYLLYFSLKKMNLIHLSTKEDLFIQILFISNIIVCGSRSSLFALALFWGLNYLQKKSGFIALFTFGLIIWLYQYLLNILPELIVSLNLQEYFRIETLSEGSGRIIAWEFAWDQAKNNIFLGNGFNYTEWIFRKNYYKLSMLGHQGNAHNSFLTLWIDIGFIGLLAFILPVIYLVLRGQKNNPALIPIFYTICFSAFFESWLASSLNPFTIYAVLILSVSNFNFKNELGAV